MKRRLYPLLYYTLTIYPLLYYTLTIPSTVLYPPQVGEWEETGNPNEEKYFSYMHSYSPYDQVTTYHTHHKRRTSAICVLTM
jgi:hypothetical protein